MPTTASRATFDGLAGTLKRSRGSGTNGCRVGTGKAPCPGAALPRCSGAIPCQQPASSTVTPVRYCERSSPVKNRKREIRTSGSVRGEDGNILTYSAMPAGSSGGRKYPCTLTESLRSQKTLTWCHPRHRSRHRHGPSGNGVTFSKRKPLAHRGI
jgi:hypothetical protein